MLPSRTQWGSVMATHECCILDLSASSLGSTGARPRGCGAEQVQSRAAWLCRSVSVSQAGIRAATLTPSGWLSPGHSSNVPKSSPVFSLWLSHHWPFHCQQPVPCRTPRSFLLPTPHHQFSHPTPITPPPDPPTGLADVTPCWVQLGPLDPLSQEQQ